MALCKDFSSKRQEEEILVLKTVPAAVNNHADNA